jgi:hypothetical protein
VTGSYSVRAQTSHSNRFDNSASLFLLRALCIDRLNESGWRVLVLTARESELVCDVEGRGEVEREGGWDWERVERGKAGPSNGATIGMDAEVWEGGEEVREGDGSLDRRSRFGE